MNNSLKTIRNKLFYVFMIFLFGFICYHSNLENKISTVKNKISPGIIKEPESKNNIYDWSPSVEIPLVTVVCSDAVTELDGPQIDEVYLDMNRQKEQIRVMLGTLLYFSRSSKWLVYIVTDRQATFDFVTDGLREAWPESHYKRLQLKRRDIKMPMDNNVIQLLHHYRPCSWQKMFLELIFPDLDSLVFVDTDVLFTGPAEDLWLEFSKFNATQAFGVSPEPQYAQETRQYAGKTGINTGMLALNLTRLKKLPSGGLWNQIVHELTQDVRFPPRNDQDTANSLLNKLPNFLYELEYRWNFIVTDCLSYAPPCSTCVSDGINMVHGAGAVFYKDTDHKFRILYFVMEKMTRNLTIQPKELLVYYEGAIEGLNGFGHPKTVCSKFINFLPFTSHALRKMTKSRNLV